MSINKKVAVYIHWPYCRSKCPYCDFFKMVKKDVNQEQIIADYLKELDFYHELIPDYQVRSVFFGGGTPSLIKPQNIEHILDYINRLWGLEGKAEISLEANPNSEYPEMFKKLKDAGINRLSLGVQALNDADLKFLGRTHNLAQALHSMEEVLKNFDNHSIDLIYARPEQTLNDWEKELRQAISFGFKHLSLYQLTIEEGTVFQKRGIKSLEEGQASQMYLYTVETLRKNGYLRYEVSNFARPGFESVHNKCYWLGDDYIGIGPSAHGRLSINKHHFAFEHPHIREELSSRERAEELVIMGLRLQSGINKQHFKDICGLELDSFINRHNKELLIKEQMLEDTKDFLRATYKGFLVLDYLTLQLCL